MRVSADNTVKLGYGAAEKSMADYAAYLQALAVKPYLSAREASIFFDVGQNRMFKLVKSDAMKPYRIHRGHSDLVRRDMLEKALLEEGDV